MSKFLDQWNDPGIKVDMGWSPETTAEQHAQRCMHMSLVAMQAQAMSRRLGGDASREEIAQDVKRARKLKNLYRQFANQHGIEGHHEAWFESQTTAQLKELRQEAAQIDWVKYIQNTTATLNDELRFIATTGLKTGHIQAANSLCNRILNEQNVLQNLLERTQIPEKTPENA